MTSERFWNLYALALAASLILATLWDGAIVLALVVIGYGLWRRWSHRKQEGKPE